MARGTVIGEPVVSQANTKAYADNYERMFGKDHKPQRGHWSFGEADASRRALDAPIMVDRFYEGAKATDGTDIGSRRRHRQYMKDHNLATADDFKGQWSKAEARREDIRQGRWRDPKRREVLERAFHEINEGKRKP